MQRRTETERDKFNSHVRNLEHLSKVLQASKAMQMRYVLIPTKALSDVTVAGVRDMNLGKVRNGRPVGGNVVRFNNPSKGTKSDFHRICIDPKAVRNKGNTHIPVSASTGKMAANIQKGLKVTGKALLVVSIVASAVRIGKAIYDEIEIDDEIEALEGIVEVLEEDLSNCAKGQRSEIQAALDTAKQLLKDAKNCKERPGKKTLLEGLCDGGEWAGAAAMGYAGAQGGGLAGAAVGGPLGAIGGAVAGGVAGAVAGSELGSSAVKNFRVDDNGIATEMQGSVVDFNLDQGDSAEVLGVDGNFFTGKGVEVGARAGLFSMENKNARMDVGKVGANVGVSNKGVDVGVEAKVGWTESNRHGFGVGLQADTGVKADEDNFELSVLGFGFTVGKNWGLKTPLFGFKNK